MSSASEKPLREVVFLVDERDRVHERVEASVVARHVGGQRPERLLRGDVAGIGLAPAEFGSQLLHLVLDPFALVDERQTSAMRVKRPGNPGCDTPAVSHARYERGLAFEQTHRPGLTPRAPVNLCPGIRKAS